MHKPVVWVALPLFALAGGCTATGPAEAPQRSEAPLLSIATFFANREANTGYRVSPDGQWLAWLASAGGRMTVHVRAREGGEVRVIDTHSTRSLGTFWWAADSRHVLFTQDRNGDQNEHVYAADTERPGESPVDLTPIGTARAMIHRVLLHDPEHLLIVHNARARQGFDLVRINGGTREMVTVAENPGDVIEWMTDHHGRLRGRVRSVGDAERLVEWRVGEEWRAGLRLDLEESFKVVGFTPDGSEAWVLTNHGRDRVALVLLDPMTGRQTLLYEHPQVDIESAVASIATGELLYAAAYPGYQEVRFFERRLKAAFGAGGGGGHEGFRLLSRDLTGRFGTLETYSDRGSAFWLVEWETGQRTLLGRSAIAEHANALARLEPVALRSRDGLTLHGYLTRPRGRVEGPGPLVLLVHGGPWARDYWSYSPMVQFLVNRGYAVLQVNYRGSTGYGRRFREAAVGEFAGKMHDDLLDAVEWAAARGVADRRRIGIMGWSYGGYATLVGLTFTPDVFACGVDVVGMSSLVSQLETRHTYWTWHIFRPFWHKYAGDPSKPEDRRRLEAKSPLLRADRLQRPLLIVHGANDPNVKRRESDQMVEALRRAGKEVEYLLFPDEGHGDFDWRNNVALASAIERFLARHLGGRRG